MTEGFRTSVSQFHCGRLSNESPLLAETATCGD